MAKSEFSIKDSPCKTTVLKSEVYCLKCERSGEYKHGYVCIDCLGKIIENERTCFLNKADNFRKEVTSLLLKQGREKEAKNVDAILKDAINYLKLSKNKEVTGRASSQD